MLPSLLILIGQSWLYMACGQLPGVAGVLHGINPAVAATGVSAAVHIGSRRLKNGALWGFAAAAFVASFALQAPFPLIVLGANLIGHLGSRCAVAKFVAGGRDTEADLAVSSIAELLCQSVKPLPDGHFTCGSMSKTWPPASTTKAWAPWLSSVLSSHPQEAAWSRSGDTPGAVPLHYCPRSNAGRDRRHVGYAPGWPEFHCLDGGVMPMRGLGLGMRC